MAQLSVYVLGSFQVRIDNRLVNSSFRTEKERALLAYLMLEPDRAFTRQFLAELLWPNRPEGVARTSLRQAISGLRRAIADQDKANPYTLLENESVQINPACAHWLDCSAFSARLKTSQTHNHASLEACASCIRGLEEAVDLYRGDFLCDLDLSNEQEFGEWITFHREHHFRNLLSALNTLSTYSLNLNDYETAFKYAWQHVNLAPLEERAHRQVMRLYALTGRRSAALEQYQSCCHLLMSELGVEPAQATVQLYEKIKHGSLVEPEAKTRPRRTTTNLPEVFTQFVGRESEIRWSAECLPNQACRLLTIVGMAGAGKTRLAVHIARENASQFSDGVHFVSLEKAQSSADIANSIGMALGFRLPFGDTVLPALLEKLRSLNALLVLDSFEHLIAETGLLVEILRQSPGMKFIVTTRRRLPYQAAHPLELQGLPFPASCQVEHAADFPAVRLFILRAQRTISGFHPSQEDLHWMVKICQQVGGLPLAIELAASMLRFLDMEQIQDSLSQDPSVLTAPLNDLSSRHRNIQDAFEQQWAMLSPAEKEAFCRLAVFAGGFTIHAAREITQVSLSSLSDLLDHSLLIREESRRFAWNPLMRAFALRKLQENPAEAGEVWDGYSHYYLSLLRKKAQKLHSSHRRMVCMREIEVELANISHALDWAIAKKWENVVECGEDLQNFYQLGELLQVKGCSGHICNHLSKLDPEDAAGDLILPLDIAGENSCCERAGRFEDSFNSLILVNLDGTVQDANYQACQTFGLAREALLSMNLHNLIQRDGRLEHGPESFAARLAQPAGNNLPVQVEVIPLPRDHPTRRLIVVKPGDSDPLSDKKEANGEPVDPLTGLYNRDAFYQHLKEAVSAAARNASQFAVVLVDVNNLKAINLKYGTGAGDVILREIAARLHQVIRSVDTVARLGSDEFALILHENVKNEVARKIAARMITKLTAPVIVSGKTIFITVCVGICFYPECGDNEYKLMGNADQAVSLAKQSGANTYHLATVNELSN